MSDLAKLEPCPFCGSPAIKRWAMLHCSVCPAMMQDQYANEAAHIKAWNRRAALSGDVRVPAARDVLAERRRQVEQEGWTAEHDDSHDKGDMALAGACYARRNLVRAAALILAEIERIDRLAAAKGERDG